MGKAKKKEKGVREIGEEARRFLPVMPNFEKLMVDSGILSLKY